MPTPTRDLVLRRRRLREAALGERTPEQFDAGARPLRGVEGTVVEASPHLLVLVAPDGSEVRVPVSASAFVWHGGKAGMSAVRPGRDVIVRPSGGGGLTAERIWVDITRVTGTIARRTSRVLEVDAGRHRRRTTLIIPAESLARVQVRHPLLEPGSLIDVIGVRRGGRDPRPAPGDQLAPAGHARRSPVVGRRSGTVPRIMRGTATWYDRAERRARRGVPGTRPVRRREAAAARGRRRPCRSSRSRASCTSATTAPAAATRSTGDRVRLCRGALLRPVRPLRHLAARPDPRTDQRPPSSPSAATSTSAASTSRHWWSTDDRDGCATCRFCSWRACSCWPVPPS